MAKFKVGDIVWCTKPGVYAVTDYHVKCKVTGVGKGRLFIAVRKLGRDVSYEVDAKFFEHVYKNARVV